MSSSRAIDNALLAKLNADAALMALCPDGAYYQIAPPGTRFVIVDLITEDDEPVFGGRGFEDGLYLVKAVMLESVAGVTMAAAEARIDALLEDQPLTVAGYTWMAMYRDGQRVRDTETDDEDATIQWLHGGAHYRVQMAVGG